jgi:hypothetical protein
MRLNEEVRRLMGQSVRAYFAPLTGAFKGIRQEFHRLDQVAKLHREREVRLQQKQQPPSD